MLQRTLITNNADELAAYIEEIKGLPEYARKGDKLLLFSSPDADRETLAARVETVRRALPGIKIVGMTTHRNEVENGFALEGEDYSFLLMEQAKAELLYYDCRKISIKDAGQKFQDAVRGRKHIAAILLFTAGMEFEIDQFLTFLLNENGGYEIPILGAQSGAQHPYICGTFRDGEPDDRGIVAVVLYGKGLSVYYNYDMGWTPIGKEMKITGTDGRTRVTSIDGRPPVDIYREYLGVEPDEYFVENVREFPFICRRGEHLVVRTPSGYDEEGGISFIARVNQGDTVQLSYGNPRRLLEKTRVYAESMQAFGPQALFLVVCENRVRFLASQAASDVAAYRAIMPQSSWMRGYTAIMLDKKGGGLVNAAIVSVGMREGAQSKEDVSRPVVLPAETQAAGAIPREQRLAMFLEKTTQELENMAVEANAANRAKSEFLSMMSHEIRTPINAVLGMNEMVLRECDDENVMTYAENAHAAGLSLLGIINEILDFSKIEAGKMEIVPQEYELASLISDLVNLIRMKAEERGLSLYVKVAPETPSRLIGDELRIKQIITNLLTNAVKYTEKGSVTLSVNYRRVGDGEMMLDVSVEDTGVGIREENIQKLFHAFDRIDAERTRKIEGTGLGINITQRLLKLMGSGLDVKSTFGVGSVFSFAVPQKVVSWKGIGDITKALKKVNDKRAKRKTRFTAPNVRILVVDDAPMNIAVISGLLKRTKIQVDTAESGEECIEKFAVKSYDLVFLDHRMPGMDGPETLGQLQRRFAAKFAETPVVSLTANAMSGAREEYIALGFRDYLSKPVMAEELEALLLRVLPPEKIVVKDETEEIQELSDDTPLPDWLIESPFFNTKKGVLFCGGNAEYLETLALFGRSIHFQSSEIERFWKEKDYDAYTIKVHSLKSMAKAVGAMKLSRLAAELEEAGKEGDISSIENGTEALLTLYRNLSKPLSRLNEEAASLSPAPKKEQADAVTTKRHTILLVDDDDDFLALTSRWLKKDYAVTAVNSGKKALAALEKEIPELLLLDYEMPDMNGAEVLRQIRANPKLKRLSVVFLTGTEDKENVRNAESLHPEGFLLKTMGKSGLLMGIAAFFD